MRRALLIAAAMTAAAAAWAGGTPAPGGASDKGAGSRSFDYIRGIGMVEGSKDTIWLMIADSTLVTGDSLTLISDEPNPDPDTYVTLISAAVAERVRDPRRDARAPRWFGMGAEDGDVLYRLTVARGALDCCIFGYAVRAPRGAFRVVSGRAEADLDGDGVFERFQSCASREGLHPSVWSGEPLRGPRRWTRYYYVGYDLEPNCPGGDSPSRK